MGVSLPSPNLHELLWGHPEPWSMTWSSCKDYKQEALWPDPNLHELLWVLGWDLSVCLSAESQHRPPGLEPAPSSDCFSASLSFPIWVGL